MTESGLPVSTNVFKVSKGQTLNWPVTTVMALFHFGALAAMFMFNWRLLAAGVFLYWLATGLGISMGYHRGLTHRSYKVPLPISLPAIASSRNLRASCDKRVYTVGSRLGESAASERSCID
jgi:hypothetical protein